MEEFVYIILIAIWLIVSFLRKKPKQGKPAGKQRPAASEETPQPVEEEINMEEMLEEFFGKGKKKKEEPRRTEEPVFEAAERPERRDDRDDRRQRADRKEERRYRESQRSWQEEERYEPAAAEKSSDQFDNFEGKEGVADDFAFASDGKVKTIDELIASHKQEEAIRKASEESEGYGQEGLEGIPDFDLRKAVIFSEILNRKYL